MLFWSKPFFGITASGVKMKRKWDTPFKDTTLAAAAACCSAGEPSAAATCLLLSNLLWTFNTVSKNDSAPAAWPLAATFGGRGNTAYFLVVSSPFTLRTRKTMCLALWIVFFTFAAALGRFNMDRPRKANFLADANSTLFLCFVASFLSTQARAWRKTISYQKHRLRCWETTICGNVNFEKKNLKQVGQNRGSLHETWGFYVLHSLQCQTPKFLLQS